MSTRTGGQIERLQWAVAEARRLRAEAERIPDRSTHRNVVLTLPTEQFTTEWQTPWLAEPAQQSPLPTRLTPGPSDRAHHVDDV